MKFSLAVANWRVAQRPAHDQGWHSTCGSAERLYAGSPERHASPPDPAGEGVCSPREAEQFEALVAQLPASQRLAWHIKTGFRPTGDKSEAWINEHYNQARAQLSVWWSRLHR